MNIKITHARVLFALTLLSMFMINTQAQEAVVWEFQAEGAITGSVQVKDGMVFIGSFDQHLYALDSETGSEVWSFETEAPIKSTVAIVDSILVLHSMNKLYGLNTRTGELLWSHIPEESLDSPFIPDDWDYHHSSPVINDSIAYYGNDYGMVYGVNINTAEEVFGYQTENKTAIRTKPLIVGDTLYVGDWEGMVSAIDVSDSSLVWSSIVNSSFLGGRNYGPVTTDIVQEGDYIFFGGHLEKVNKMNRHTGEVSIVFDHGGSGWVSGFPAINDGNMFIGGSDYHNIMSINLNTNKLNWSFKTANQERIFSQPVFADSIMIVATGGGDGGDANTKGVLYFLKHSDGAPFAKINVLPIEGVGQGILNTPYLEGQFIYFGTRAGKVYKIDLKNYFENLTHNIEVDTTTTDLGNLSRGLGGYISKPKSFTIHNKGTAFEEIKILTVENSLLDIGINNKNLGFNESASVSVSAAMKEKIVGEYEETIQIYAKSTPDTVYRKKFTFRIPEATSIEEEDSQKNFSLYQNYPNPFNPNTSIAFELSSANHTTLKVYDISGRLVTTLIDGFKQGGSYQLPFSGENISSGVYFYILRSGEFSEQKKMLLLK